MSYTQILLIGTAIVAIIYGLIMLLEMKSLIILPSNELTLEEKKAIQRGEMKVEKAHQIYRWWLFFAIITPITANIIFGDKIRNCELMWGLDGYFWQNVIWVGIFVLSTICYMFITARRYRQALQTGFMPRLTQNSQTQRVLIKASPSQIHLAFFAKFATALAVLLVIFILASQTIPPRVKNIGLENLPKTSLSTYQIASQKLQQECLARKEK